MDYKISQDQAYKLMNTILDKQNIKIDIMYRYDNGIDKITGTIYLYKKGEIFGYKHGYEFYFKYDSRFNKLTPNDFYPNIHKLGIFKLIPEDIVIQYFTEKVKDYLVGYIDKGYSSLKRNS